MQLHWKSFADPKEVPLCLTGTVIEDLLALLHGRASAKVDAVALHRRRVEHGHLSVGLKIHCLGGGSQFSTLVEGLGPVKRFADLTEQETLALAITNEDEDSRIYRGFAEGLRAKYPASAKVFEEMAEEEVRHRTMLFDLYRTKFGEYLPLIRRQD